VAWSPDGRILVGAPSGQLKLLDVGSGETVPLGIGGAVGVAFSPDGRQLAVQLGRELKVVDVDTRAVRTVAELDARQTLAGPGAWSAGGRLAIWDGTDCGPACPAGHTDLRLSLVDISDGAVTVAGLDPVQAASARLLGWQVDGDAVVVLAMTSPEPAGPHSGTPQVLALHPGGGRTTLMTLPAGAGRVDIARTLLDHFGGEPRSRWELFLDVVRVRLAQAAPWLAVIALLVAALVTYRRLRGRVRGSRPDGRKR
jgi:hypothetical protein